MFGAFSCPSSGVTTTAVAASGLPSECGGSNAVGHGRPTALLLPRSYGKPEAAAAVDRLLMMGIRMTETY
jgi:hypothetical protein